MKHSVLFICTGNSCRSQIAEGILQNEAGNEMDIFSAGSHPSRLHPAAISVMEEWGIDISHQKSESINNYINKDINIIITVCDNANQSCPVFPNGKIRRHWSVKDPFNGWGNNQEDLQPYRDARDQLKKRIDEFLLSENIDSL
jgi:arsenate reductase